MRLVVAWDVAEVIPLRAMSEGKLGSSKRGGQPDRAVATDELVAMSLTGSSSNTSCSLSMLVDLHT